MHANDTTATNKDLDLKSFKTIASTPFSYPNPFKTRLSL